MKKHLDIVVGQLLEGISVKHFRKMNGGKGKTKIKSETLFHLPIPMDAQTWRTSALKGLSSINFRKSDPLKKNTLKVYGVAPNFPYQSQTHWKIKLLIKNVICTINAYSLIMFSIKWSILTWEQLQLARVKFRETL